ncbi:MAG TPA: flagellar basal body-associated FliL family protein [Clostridium sp.]|uniref:flagellar basal body-associated FliL family protein n=1 Tax=Clostridium sp. TaxID=1506 RepID=UPI002F946BB8
MSDKPKKGNGLKIVIIVLLVLIVVGGAAFGGMYLAGQKGTSTTPKVVVVNEITYSLDEFLLNLTDVDSKRYLKVIIFIGYEDNKKLTTELDTKKPIIRDAVIAILREKKTTDFNTTAGVDLIKNQLIATINPTLTTGKISHIYFNDLLVQ